MHRGVAGRLGGEGQPGLDPGEHPKFGVLDRQGLSYPHKEYYWLHLSSNHL